jgi:hypothetical protein
MGTISASQCSLKKAKQEYPSFASALEPAVDSPNLVWVVFSGETVVGVFPDWPSASAKIGEIEAVQLSHWLESHKPGTGFDKR